MGDAGFFRGTSTDQDSRWGDKEKKLLKQLQSKFPPEFSTPVDLKKVKIDVIKPWITDRVTELLGVEDEVVIEYIFSILESDEKLDPRKMQINLTGFLSSKTKVFMKELWVLFLSAQSNPHGIPTEWLEKKKEEQRQRMEEEERIQQAMRGKYENEVRRAVMHTQVRQNMYQQMVTETLSKATEMGIVERPADSAPPPAAGTSKDNEPQVDRGALDALADAGGDSASEDETRNKARRRTRSRSPRRDDRRDRNRARERRSRSRSREKRRSRSRSRDRAREKDRRRDRSRSRDRKSKKSKDKKKKSKSSRRSKSRSRSRSPKVRNDSDSSSEDEAAIERRKRRERLMGVDKSNEGHSKWDEDEGGDAEMMDAEELRKKALESMRAAK